MAVFAMGCPRSANRPTASAPVSLPDRRIAGDGTVGAQACAPCHPDIHALHAKSRHARALARFDAGVPAHLLPPEGTISNSDGVIVRSPGAAAISVPGEGDPLPFTLAFGSGKSGVTYAATMGEELFEFHRSWHPATKRWYGTPGHERMPAQNLGMMYTTEQARTCIGCHATALPAKGLVPEPKLLGIGCEACHGPGKAHISAMESTPRGPVSLRVLKGATPELVNGVCGQCHRARESISSDNSEVGQTNRFQMVGMLKSRCYLDSSPKMTCVTCHAPHGDAPTRLDTYERACMTCHVAPRSTCPVNPSKGCVGCHMPKRPAFTNHAWPSSMADHWIRISGRASPSPRP